MKKASGLFGSNAGWVEITGEPPSGRGPGVVPVVPQTADHDHVTQVETIFRKRVLADRLLQEDVGEDLVVELVGVAVQIS